jgi:hypothetical protein
VSEIKSIVALTACFLGAVLFAWLIAFLVLGGDL